MMNISTTDLNITTFLINIAVALLVGLAVALVYSYKTRHSRGFIATLAMLPAVVAMVIMMVNGSIGAGIAVAGAFSLVRFRSIPGTAKEIAALFLAMSAGLGCGMGQWLYTSIFAAIMCLVMFIYNSIKLGAGKDSQRVLNITIPEDLDYTGVFTDLMESYTNNSKLTRVKTMNMGSMMKLTYEVELKDPQREKEFLDDLRCRNGNLEISASGHMEGINEL